MKWAAALLGSLVLTLAGCSSSSGVQTGGGLTNSLMAQYFLPTAVGEQLTYDVTYDGTDPADYASPASPMATTSFQSAATLQVLNLARYQAIFEVNDASGDTVATATVVVNPDGSLTDLPSIVGPDGSFETNMVQVDPGLLTAGASFDGAVVTPGAPTSMTWAGQSASSIELTGADTEATDSCAVSNCLGSTTSITVDDWVGQGLGPLPVKSVVETRVETEIGTSSTQASPSDLIFDATVSAALTGVSP